jgi:uncharacterized protein (TIGR03118 family)
MFTAFRRMAFNHKRRSPSTPPMAHPRLEQLEDRCLLSLAYLQTNLVSDLPGVANITDPNLVNPWGIAAGPSGAVWLADNGTGLSTLYDGSGNINSLVVTIPPPMGGTGPAAPDGIVFNGTSDFMVSSGGKSGAAAFIFTTEDGTISGWSPAVNRTNAILEVDNSASGAVYKGLALGSNANGNMLYATNFRAGTVDVFNTNYKPVNLGPNAFKDPMLPAGFAPFGIDNIGGKLYVSYALQDSVKHDDVAGAGNGFIDVYDTNGNLLQHFASAGTLNSPWGMVLAPSNFGMFSNDLLVGNFGNGLINAFNPTTGAFLGQLMGVNGNLVDINGLWGLAFGNGNGSGATNTLYFTAGLNGENDGLYGTLQASVTGSANDRFVDQVYQDLLNRQADAAGLAFWTGALDQGATRSQVVAGIESSTEYETDQVQNAYQQFLHRAADPAGVTFWVNFLQQGNTVEQMDAGIVSSQEYVQNRGGGTNTGFLTALFQDALGRSLDSNAQTVFTQQFAAGATFNEVATEVFSSTEFQQDLVKSDYQQLLNRAADTTGLNFYVATLQQGATDQQIAAIIAGSDEFFNRL